MVQKALPEADLVLRASARAPDFAAEEADVMIGFHDRGHVRDGAVALMEPRMLPVASPGWIRDHGLPLSLAALARQPLVHEESHQQWRDWFEAAGVPIGHELSGPRLSDANLGLDAALAGVGVALATPFMALEEIARGRLVELFKTNVFLGRYYLLRSPALRNDALTQRFQDWLVAEYEASERM
jgi:LysR family glycine cleavage system transcriptional activator